MTELWERFAYYGMLSLLILYLTKVFLLGDAEGNKLVATYGALIWMLPVLGGIVSDRLLGSRKSVTLGAIFMAVGFISISFPGLLGWIFIPATGTPPLDSLFFSMAIIITGVGFLKTNISTVVGALYALDDPRRESGFTIFYMGINIGGALGPIICGGLGQWFGMQYGFSAAGAGMLIGLAIFLGGQRYLGGRADPPDPARLRKKLLPGLNTEAAIYLVALLAVVGIWQALHLYEILSGALLWFAVFLGLLILYFSVFRCDRQERDRMLVVSSLIVFAVVFWSLYMQMFGSLLLFSDRFVDRSLLGYRVAASQLQGLPSIFVILLAPLFGVLWLRLGKRGHNPNIPVKFALSLVLVGLAFMMPFVGHLFAENSLRIPLFWFAMIFFLMVMGELCQAPIAMSMITKFCPRRYVGMMLGSYFVALAIGSIVAGELAARFLQTGHSGAEALEKYISVYGTGGLFAVAAGCLVYLLSPFLYRCMHDHDEVGRPSHILRLYLWMGILALPKEVGNSQSNS